MLRKVTVLTSLILTLGFFSTSLNAEPNSTQDEIMRQLRRVEILSVQISDHAGELKSMITRPYLSISTQEWELTQAADRAETIGKDIPKLQAMSDKADWQKDTIDRIAAYTKAMASEIDSAIRYVQKNQNEPALRADPYRKRVNAIKDFADEIESLVDYAKTRQNLAHFEAQM